MHIIGLNIDHTNTNLIHNLQELRSLRLQRGKKIAAKLDKLGIHNSLELALKYAKSVNALSRTHFAKFLISNGHATLKNVFSKYLGENKPAYVKQTWTTLENAVKIINNSGGVAIIAHPVRYKMNRNVLKKLIEEFKMYGGHGIEVIHPSHSIQDITNIITIANQHQLYGSCGNDFHELTPNIKVGKTIPLPSSLLLKINNLLDLQ